MIKIQIELKETSQKIELEAKNTYTKGPFYCIYTTNEVVHKFPIANIWRVKEGYSEEKAPVWTPTYSPTDLINE